MTIPSEAEYPDESAASDRTRPVGERSMPKAASAIIRDQLIKALNEDLSREYQAIISYVNYSQVLKGAAYTKIADELTIHAKEELDHALTISSLVDYLGGM